MSMSKEDRWVRFACGALAGGNKGHESRRLADVAEEDFISRFPEKPPEPSLTEQAHRHAAERGCIGVVVLDPQTIVEILTAHVAANLEPGQHVEFAATAKHPCIIGIGERGETMKLEDVPQDAEDGTVLRIDRVGEEPGAVDREAYDAAVAEGRIVPLPIANGPDVA